MKIIRLEYSVGGIITYDHEVDVKALKLAAMLQKKENEAKPKRIKHSIPQHAVFKSGIVKLNAITHPNLVMDKNAKDYLSFQLYTFTTKLSKRVSEIIGDRDLEPIDLKNAMSEFLGPQVMKHAKCEGNRLLALHANGLLDFQPKRPSIQMKEESNSKTKKSSNGSSQKSDTSSTGTNIFKDGIKRMLLEDFNQPTLHSSIDQKCLKRFEMALFEATDYFSSLAVETALQKSLNVLQDSEIKETVREVFPDVMMQHALCQASTKVKMHHDGVLVYRRKIALSKPRDPSKSSKKKKSPKSPKKSKKRKVSPPRRESQALLAKPKRKKERKPDFTEGIVAIFKEILPRSEVGISDAAVTLMNNCLNDVCFALVTDSVTTCEESEMSLSAEEIKNSVGKLFAEPLAQHAIARGSTVLSQSVIIVTSSPSREMPKEQASLQKSVDPPSALQIRKTSSPKVNKITPKKENSSLVNEIIPKIEFSAKAYEAEQQQESPLEENEMVPDDTVTSSNVDDDDNTEASNNNEKDD